MMISHPLCFPFVVSPDRTSVPVLTPLKDGHASVSLTAYTHCHCVHFHNWLFVVQKSIIFFNLLYLYCNILTSTQLTQPER